MKSLFSEKSMLAFEILDGSVKIWILHDSFASIFKAWTMLFRISRGSVW